MSELLNQFRAKYPQYQGVPDAQLADGIYNKFYAGKIERADFDARAMAAPPIPEPRTMADVKPKQEPYTGGIIPFSKDAEGNVRFDSDAGILGPIKRTVMLPGQVLKGEVDPNSREGIARTMEAALMMSPMGVAQRASGGVPFAKSAYRQVQKKAPTREALKAATDAGYKEARDMGAEYSPKAIAGWADDMARALDAEGRIAENYPEVHSLLNKLRSPPKGARSITLESVDAVYRELGRLAGSPDKAKASAANMVQRGLDEFHSSLDPSAIVAGPASAQKAAQVLKDARGNAAAGFRSDRITGLEQTSARRAAAANSGRNADNTIRQRLTSLIESQKGSRGLSEAEEQAIDDIIFGRPTKNAARYVSNLMGAGGGIGQAMMSGLSAGGGFAAGGAPGAVAGAMVPALVGGGARTIANTMTKRELSALDDLIRMRSPLYNATPNPAPVYQPGMLQGGTEAMIKALGATPMPQPVKLKPGWI